MRLPFLPLPFLLLLPAVASAQTPARTASGGDTHADVPAAAAALATAPLRIDGVLDEESWQTATPITRFTQVVPAEGAPASEETELRFLYDDGALYIGARMHDRQPVTTRLGRRDMSMEASDWLTIIFDSYHDHRTAFGFEVNPSGVRRDQTRSPSSEDDSWEPVWEVQTRVDAEGWTAEIRIPFSQLRFNPLKEQVWGLQVERQIARNGEFSVFSFTPTDQPGGIPRFGHLAGLVDIATGKRTEILPYSVMKAAYVDPGQNPFREDAEYTPSFGVDVKYRVTSDLTLDATLNPDFGQVEVDPAEVNLSVIETRFQEKRPFFVEGSEIFNFGAGGGNQAFYSRRVGRAPQVGVPGGAQGRADVPSSAGILGAAKLSGRTAGGWSVGVLDAVTRREEARFYDLETGEIVTSPVEPLSNYFVGRLRKDYRAGQTAIGGMLTAVNRDLADEPVLERTLHSSAYMGGVDFRHQWDERTWTLSGFVAGSRVAGDRQAIYRTQHAPWHYFQRPDAVGIGLDSTRTAMTGLSTQVDLSKRVGRHWRFNALAGTTTPDYEVNDLGFQYRANRIDVQGGFTYLDPRVGKTFRHWQVNPSARAEWNYDGEHIINSVSMSAFARLLNYWEVFSYVSTFLGSSMVDDRLTRGGPLARRPATGRAIVNLSSDPRKKIAAGAEFDYERNVEGGWSMSMGPSVTLRPTGTVDLRLQPFINRSHVAAQYVGAVQDSLATNTFGRRYLFAELDQTTVALETRLNVTFTPSLSLQLYAQPYISSGDYGDLAEFARPRSFDFLVYGRDVGTVSYDPARGRFTVDPDGAGDAAAFEAPNRDFNFRSLRGNAVLRWEYRPGSTFYAAWQQERSDYAALVGDFAFGRDRSALFRAQPDNVFVLKASYWLNP